MSLPGDLTTSVVVGTYVDSAGVPQRGRVQFTPSTLLADATGSVVIPPVTRVYNLSAQGTFTTDPLVATDCETISPQGWQYEVQLSIAGLQPQSWNILLPASGSPADISGITPVVPQAAVTSYLPQSGGTVSGTLTVAGTLQIPSGAASGDVLTSDSSGNASWGAPGAIAGATSSALGGVELNTDLGGTATAPHVVATHLASALPIAQGGTAVTASGVANVRAYGAQGNAVQVTDGAMTASSATLTCTSSHPFTTASAGMTAVVQGAGAAGADLVTTISAYTSSSTVTLAAAAGTTVSSATVTAGTDDTSAIQAAVTAAFATGGAGIYFPASAYLTTGQVSGTAVGNGMRVYGDGNGSLLYATGSYDVLHFTNGTGLTVSDLQIQSALTAPTAGAALSVNSIADYRIDKVTTGGTFYGVVTSGGTSKTANTVNSYIDAYAIGMYAPGSCTIIGSHVGGGAIGLILDSGSGHSVRLIRTGLYGPLPLTTRNSTLGATPNKTMWFQAVECNYQTGLGSGALTYMTGTETAGGMNLDNCGGDVHISQCWLSGSGLTIGGGVIVSGGRSDTGCTVTSGSTTVLDSHILSGDNGSAVYGQGIPSGATISSVSAGVSFVMSAAATFSSARGTPSGTVTVNVGGTSAGITPTWVDIVGGGFSGNTLTLANGIHLKAGKEITITGAHLTGSADHTLYDDILIDSAVTGPVTISGCEFSGNSNYNINSAATSGPFTFSGNSHAGFSASVPVNYPGGSASQYTVIGGGAATALPAALPLSSGGTGSGTQQAAINALTGSQSAGHYLRSDGTNASLAAIQAGDVPALNQNTTGTAAGLSATLAIGSGGTGSSTRNFSGLLTPTATKTTTYTAAAGDLVICDISAGGFTVTLPSAPASLTVVGVKVIAAPSSGINTLTVSRGGSDHIDTSSTTSVTLSTLNQSKVFQYVSGIWTTVTGELSLTQMDKRYTGWFNVRNYGALGNGSNDDTAAIQAAANALSANGGGTLYFPNTSGDYKTTGTVTLSSYGDGLHVMGDGYGSRIKATGNYDTFYVDAGNGVAFSYLYFDSTVGSNHTDFGSVTRTDASCTTTSGSAVVTDASCKAADLGRTVTGTGIPAGTYIQSVTAGSQFTMTQNATASGTVSLTITDTSCNTASGSAVVIDTQIGTVDVGKAVSGPGIPNGTTISSVVAGYSFTMSANATATASNVQLIITGSTAGAAINFQTGGTVRMNNVWIYNSYNGITCYNGGGRTEIVGCWIYGRNYGIYTQNPLHILSTGISGDSVGVVSDSCNGSLWMIGCDLNGICSLVCRNTLGIGQPNYGITLINVGANYNGGGVYPPEAILPGGTLQPIGFDFASCYGELRMYACYASGASLRMGGRTDTGCGTTSGSPTVTDTSILSSDLGKNVSGTGIPSGTVIQTVTPGVGFTMCQVVPASGNHLLATQTAVNATATGTVSLLIGVATQDVEILGGDYGADNSSPVHSIPQAIRIQAGAKIRISGIQCQGAATNAYNGIQLDAPVTGPLSITNCQWTQSTLNCIDASALTTGPFNFSGNQFNGEFTGAGIAYNATYASQFTFVGNDAGPNLVNGAALGGSTYDGQVNTYAGPLTTAATGITSTSLANFTALGVAVSSGDTYEIEWLIYYQVSVNANNVGWGVSNPSVSYSALDMWAAKSGTTIQINGGTITSSGSFTQITTGTTFPLKLRVVAAFTASGTVYPQLSAGTAGTSTLTVQAGSYGVARRIS